MTKFQGEINYLYGLLKKSVDEEEAKKIGSYL
jgi:hypothetical protein